MCRNDKRGGTEAGHGAWEAMAAAAAHTIVASWRKSRPTPVPSRLTQMRLRLLHPDEL